MDGPVIVDSDGNYYGYFTLNKYNKQTQIQWIVWVLENYEYVIGNFDQISQNF